VDRLQRFEQAMTMPIDEPTTGDERATIALIVDALRDKFGDRAIAIAQAQLASADGEARNTWSAIVEMLTTG
jgi:hypothetical protein